MAWFMEKKKHNAILEEAKWYMFFLALMDFNYFFFTVTRTLPQIIKTIEDSNLEISKI